MPSAMLLKIYRKISKPDVTDQDNNRLRRLQQPRTDANNTYQTQSDSATVRPSSLNRKHRKHAFRGHNKIKPRPHTIPNNTTGIPSLEAEDVTPQKSKLGYLYKREGLHDFRTKRHFRLSRDGGLKTYKSEQDTSSYPTEDIALDFMRCEVVPGVPDTTSPPRYYFTLKSDDLSGKSYFLAAESDYERKTWMVSINTHIDEYRQPSVVDISYETRIYLNILEEDSSDGYESEASSSDEFNLNSDSSDEIYAPVGRGRIVPPVSESHEDDDGIYGEFDVTSSNPGPIQDLTASVRKASVEASLGGKDVTAPCNFLHHDTVGLQENLSRFHLPAAHHTTCDKENLYMGAEDVGVAPAAAPVISSTPSTVTQDLGLSNNNSVFSDDHTYADGFSLPRPAIVEAAGSDTLVTPLRGTTPKYPWTACISDPAPPLKTDPPTSLPPRPPL